MKNLQSLISLATMSVALFRLAVASLAFGLIIPSAYAHTADDPFVTDLIAGGGNPASAIDVGDVLVWNDGEQLFVRYDITAPDWCLTETHSHVASSADAIPQTKKGNPIPGKFAFSATLECVTSYTLVVPLTWELGFQLIIATHASLQNPTVVYSNGPWTETAWGAGFDFPGRNWATYFTYTVQEPTASLGDFVWEDQNQNGVQDSGEPGIPGVTVELLDSDGNLLATTTTDANGQYQFSELTPGGYSVRFVPPGGFVFTVPDVGDDTIDSDANPGTGGTGVSLAAGEINLTIDAGLVQEATASLGDYVWEDLNANAVQDPGEPGIPGVTVNLLDFNGNVIATTTTDANGNYLFSGLQVGTYSVRVDVSTLPQGGTITTPIEQAVSLAAGEVFLDADFGWFVPG
jgi:hypothetical protein